MKKAFEKVMAGLGDVRAYLKGVRDGFEVHEIKVRESDDRAIQGETMVRRDEGPSRPPPSG